MRSPPTCRRCWTFLRPRICAYDGRALFVSGAASDYIGRVHHGAVWDRFPQAEFAVIDGSGHYPHVEQPDAFFERITLFLDSAYA